MLAVNPDRLNQDQMLLEAPAFQGADPDSRAVVPADRDGLSTDYLNHYSEILMLIEMASFDEGIVAELSAWQPIGYRDYL